jgi:uncharacterized membrane protein YhaH (DUF805 family)
MNYYLYCLKTYINFSGRARGSEYRFFTVFYLLFLIIFSQLGILIDFYYLGLIYNITFFLPAISVGVRRMHDLSKRGWFMLFPTYNLILVFTEGSKGDNHYGADSKNKLV